MSLINEVKNNLKLKSRKLPNSNENTNQEIDSVFSILDFRIHQLSIFIWHSISSQNSIYFILI